MSYASILLLGHLVSKVDHFPRWTQCEFCFFFHKDTPDVLFLHNIYVIIPKANYSPIFVTTSVTIQPLSLTQKRKDAETQSCLLISLLLILILSRKTIKNSAPLRLCASALKISASALNISLCRGCCVSGHAAWRPVRIPMRRRPPAFRLPDGAPSPARCIPSRPRPRPLPPA